MSRLTELQARAIEATRLMGDGRLITDVIDELDALHERAGLNSHDIHLSITMAPSHYGVALRLSVGAVERGGPSITIGNDEPFLDITREALRARWARAFVDADRSDAHALSYFGLTQEDMLPAIASETARMMREHIASAFEGMAANGGKITFTDDGVQRLADGMSIALGGAEVHAFAEPVTVEDVENRVIRATLQVPAIHAQSMIDAGFEPTERLITPTQAYVSFERLGEAAREGLERVTDVIYRAAEMNLISTAHTLRLMGSPLAETDRGAEIRHIIKQDRWTLDLFFKNMEVGDE